MEKEIIVPWESVVDSEKEEILEELGIEDWDFDKYEIIVREKR
jgi:DNA-directed RNA polymerase subunit H (RpoH/RPB5)